MLTQNHQPYFFVHNPRWGSTAMNRVYENREALNMHESERHGWGPVGALLLGLPVMLAFLGVNFAIVYAFAWSFVTAFQLLGHINFAQFIALVFTFKAAKSLVFTKRHKFQTCNHRAKGCHPPTSRTSRCRPSQFMNRYPPASRMSHCRPSVGIIFQPQQQQPQQQPPQQIRLMNVSDNEKQNIIELSFDVTGAQADDLNLSVDNDGVLAVSRVDGSSLRHFQLNKRAVDVENLAATVSDGVLTVKAPKRLEAATNGLEVPILEKREPIENAEQAVESEKDVKLDTPVQDERAGHGQATAVVETVTEDDDADDDDVKKAHRDQSPAAEATNDHEDAEGVVLVDTPMNDETEA